MIAHKKSPLFAELYIDLLKIYRFTENKLPADGSSWTIMVVPNNRNQNKFRIISFKTIPPSVLKRKN
ncbi:MAG: hypothetical protein CMD98_03690 [Gammaproteobacteria bacterium]|nr:hypothetical protein [Gammaproteobacteria bacterium]